MPPRITADESHARREANAAAIRKALDTAVRLMDDPDPRIALKATELVLRVECTRMRHGTHLLNAPAPDQVEVWEELGPVHRPAPPLARDLRDLIDPDDEFDDAEPPVVLTPAVVAEPVTEPRPVAPPPEPTVAEEEHADDFRDWLRHDDRTPPLAETVVVPQAPNRSSRAESGCLVSRRE